MSIITGVVYSVLFILIDKVLDKSIYLYILNILSLIVINIFIVNKFIYFNKIADILDVFVNKNKFSDIDINGKGCFSRLGKNIVYIIKEKISLKKINVVNECSLIIINKDISKEYNLEKELLEKKRIDIINTLTKELEYLDIKSEIEKSIGLYEDEIKNKELDIIVSIENLEIKANRNLMDIIINEVLENIILYAKENTRVYVELDEIDEKSILYFKNVSKEIVSESDLVDINKTGLKLCEGLLYIQDMELKIEINADLYILICIYIIIVVMRIWMIECFCMAII